MLKRKAMKFTPTQTLSIFFKRFPGRGIAFLTFALFLFMGSDLKASHIVGGDITYKCLGNNKYEITLNVFRDCFYGDPEAWFDDPAYVGIYRKSDNVRVQQVNMYFSGINDTLTNFITDTCLFVPPAVCVHATQYKKIVTIPYLAQGYELVYVRCCRNQTINNIVDPYYTGATFTVTLTGQAMQECNTAPNFGGVAPIYICVNQPTAYDHSAIEPDGDSLVYKLCTPFTGGTFNFPQPPPPSVLNPFTEVDWLEVPGHPYYNVDNMLGAESTPPDMPLTIDPHTGVLMVYPTKIGQFVVGVSVEEYRNGVLLTTVRRDFQYNVGECGEVIASIFAPDAQCDNLTVEFQNESTFAGNFLWYFDWGGDLSLTSTEVNPTFTFPDTGWYTVALIAEPTSVCVDTSFHQIYLQYNSLFTDFNVRVFDCVDTSVIELIDLTYDTVSPVVFWLWEVEYGMTTLTSNQQHPVFQVPLDVSGTVTLTTRSQNGCEQSVSYPFVSGTNEFPNSLIADSHTLCLGDSAVLNPQADSLASYPFWWEPDELFADPTSPEQTVSPGATTVYTAYITAVDSICFARADITVTVVPLPELGFDYDVDCNGRTVNFTNTSLNSDGYFWDFGDPTSVADTSSLADPVYSYPDTGTYVVTLMTGPDAFCKDTLVQQVLLLSKFLEADFSYELGDCDVDSVVVYFTDLSQNDQNNTVAWSWDFGPLGSSTLQNPALTVFQSDTIEVMFTITTAEDCQDSLTRKIWVQMPEDQYLVDEIVICPGESAELNPGGNPDLVYLWSPPDGLSDPTAPNPVASPDQSTIYTVTISVLDFNTCYITREVDVTVPPVLNLTTSGDVATCNPQITLTAATDAPATITWENAPGGPVTGTEITVPVSGITTYFITAEDLFGCTEQTQLTVQGGPVDYAITADSIIICSDEPFDVSVTNLDPNDVLAIQWDPNPAIVSGGNTGNPVISNEPGQTVLYVTMTNQFNCQAEDSVYLAIVDENIQLDFDYEIVDCDGLIVQFTNLSQNAYDYVWSFGDAGAVSLEENPAYTYPDIDIYQVTLDVLYDVACVLPMTKPVELLEPILEADFAFSFPDCEEDEVTIQLTDQSASFLDDITEWSWTFSNGQTSTLQNPSVTLIESQVLTATLAINTALDCKDTITHDIPIVLTTVNLADTIILCYGDTAFLNPFGNPDFEYNWFPPTGLSDPAADNPEVFILETTTYNVEVTNFVGDTCKVFRSITVVVPPLIELDASGGAAIACNEPITIDVEANLPDLLYVWTDANGNPIGTGPSVVVFPTNTTNYYVTGVDPYGCSGRDTVVVTVPNPIYVTVEGASVSCQEEVMLEAISSVGDVTYQWFSEGGMPIGGDSSTLWVNPGFTSTFTVIVTDTFGCQASDTALVLVPETIELTVSEDMISCYLPVQLVASANVPVFYIWTTQGQFVDTTAIITVDPGITTWYTVLGTDSLGCQAKDSVLVTVPVAIELEVTPDTVACEGPVLISASGNVPLDFEWWSTGPDTTAASQISVLPDTTLWYYVLGTDNFGCEALDSVFVTNGIVDIQTAGQIISCPVPSTTVEVINSDPFDLLSYVWTAGPGGTILSSDTLAEIIVSTIPGDVVFNVVATNQFGCSDAAAVTVLMSDFEPVISDTIPVCAGIPTPINPLGNPNYTYNWEPVVGGIDPSDPNPVATLSTSQTFTVTITDFQGVDTCSAVLEVTVLVNPDIELDAQGDTTLCEYIPTTLTATTGVSPVFLTWFDDPALSDQIGIGNSIVVEPEGDMTYYVLAEDALGCFDTATVQINAFPIDISALPQYDLCIGEDMTIEVINNAPDQTLTYDWQPVDAILEGGNTATPLVNPMASTTFTVVVENQYGCVDSASTFVNVVDVLTGLFATADPDSIYFNSGVSSQLETIWNEDYVYNWWPDESLSDATIFNPLATPNETTVYYVEVMETISEAGCRGVDSVVVVVLNPPCEPPYIFVPSGFTPNGDGENDILYVYGNGIDPDKEFYFAVYSRWGQMVFETTDPATGWDGTFKGEALPPDVFGYYLQCNCFNQDEYFEKGNITLLR